MSAKLERHGDRIIVRTPLLRTSLMVLGSLGFVVAGALIFAAAVSGLLEALGRGGASVLVSLFFTILYALLGVVAVLFFGYSLVFLSVRVVSRIFGKGVLLEIGPDGFVDRASAVGVGFVPWEEISRLRFQSVAGQRFLVVRVRDGDALLGCLSPFKRAIIRLNRWRYTGGEISVPVSHTGLSERELWCEIKTVRERFKAGRERT